MAGGRPTDYSEEIAQEICDRMSEGESVVKICKDAHMPVPTTVINWKMRYPEFLVRYEQAKELCSEHLASLVVDVSRNKDDSIPDRRIEIDAIKWQSGRLRLKPKVEQEKPVSDNHDDDFESKKQDLIDQIKEELGKD